MVTTGVDRQLDGTDSTSALGVKPLSIEKALAEEPRLREEARAEEVVARLLTYGQQVEGLAGGGRSGKKQGAMQRGLGDSSANVWYPDREDARPGSRRV